MHMAPQIKPAAIPALTPYRPAIGQRPADGQIHTPPRWHNGKEFTDKGAEAGREHTYMKVFLKIQLFIRQIEKECQKTGPHIEKIQTVETVPHHQKESRQGIGPGLSLQKQHKGTAGQAAGACVQQRAGQPSNSKIVRYQRTGGNQNPVPPAKHRPPCLRVACRSQSRQQKCQGKSQGGAVDQPAVSPLPFFFQTIFFLPHNLPPIQRFRKLRRFSVLLLYGKILFNQAILTKKSPAAAPPSTKSPAPSWPGRRRESPGRKW